MRLTTDNQPLIGSLPFIIHALFLDALRLHMFEDMKAEADRAAAFINREFDRRFQLCGRQRRKRRKKKKKKERRIWLASRRSVSKTSNMLIQPLHSHMHIRCQKESRRYCKRKGGMMAQSGRQIMS